MSPPQQRRHGIKGSAVLISEFPELPDNPNEVAVRVVHYRAGPLIRAEKGVSPCLTTASRFSKVTELV